MRKTQTMHAEGASIAPSIAASALKVLIGLWSLLAVAAIFVMTLGTDEAWVLNGMRSMLQPYVAHLSTEPVSTSGGAFALINLAIERAAGNSVWVHRLPSLVLLGLAFSLVLRMADGRGPSNAYAWLTLAPLIAIPGGAEVGTAALGTSTGLVFMVAAIALWTSPRRSIRLRIIGTGLLYGLAAASRFDLVLFGPALILASSWRADESGKVRISWNLASWSSVSIGVAVFALNHWLMNIGAHGTAASDIGSATGLSGWGLNYPRLLNRWLTATTFAPFPFLAIAVVSALWALPDSVSRRKAAVASRESLLAVTGTVLLAGWLLSAPIPHLRYAYPALFCFAALGALGLQRAAAWSVGRGSAYHFMLCHFVALACVVGSVASTTRSLVMSNSDYASWVWTHEMAYDYFRRFEARRDQEEVGRFLRDNLPQEAVLYSYVPYALRYLTQRPVIALDKAAAWDSPTGGRPRYIVLTPAVGTYFYLPAAVADWLQRNGKLARQIGRYSIYAIAEQTEPAPDLKLRRTNYNGHPDSQPWFGR